MSKARVIGPSSAGSTIYRCNVNLNTAGGTKKQGLPFQLDRRTFQDRAVKRLATGDKRDYIFTLNQIGGIGRVGRYRRDGIRPQAPYQYPLRSKGLSSQLYSKNNTTSGGFQIGEEVNKDMENSNYTYEYDPQNYPDYFPGMAPFIDENIVVGDKLEEDRLFASQWNDWGNDVFDDWGFFYLYDVEQGKYYFPLISPQNEADGELFVQTCNAFGRTFTIMHGYPVQGIFKFDISVNDDKPFKFGAYGNMGSDEDEVKTFLTYPYSIGSTNLTLYYVKQEEDGDSSEIVYTYCIPKKVSENNSQTYNLYQDSGQDDNSWMSTIVTNGLLVYFSKTNDVKEWVVNDLGLV